eukprot:scaffold107135_cov73-Phaeocystis_antarctica.AAC.2
MVSSARRSGFRARWCGGLALGPGPGRGAERCAHLIHILAPHLCCPVLRSKPILPLPRALSSFLHPCEPIPNTTLEEINTSNFGFHSRDHRLLNRTGEGWC